ncbi:twin-arginine translocation signal domain-containing protein [Natronococcus wangiae]|uniref:twin-arginine translocation signal domain-containing protein n=1 Tax=Natronococcus wangiae TaxID=3068275 RepID=UPI0027402D56|nr:twin-arginine translocation signal domain-containing protein [Natronococcus sp. AD5]
MNRRTVLQSAGVAAVASLAGCVEAVEDHFTGGLRQPVPIEITNVGERPYNIHLEARARDAERKTYEESYTVVPDERVSAPHVRGSEQRFRVRRFGDDHGADDLVETSPITETSQLILITIHDDELELEVITDEEEAEERQEEENVSPNETGNTDEDAREDAS